MLIWGRNDYTARLEAYFNELCPEETLEIISFPLECEEPGNSALELSPHRGILMQLEKNVEVYAAFTQGYRQIAVDELKKYGFSNIIFYNTDVDNQLKKEYFRKVFSHECKTFQILAEMTSEHEVQVKSVAVYMAKSVVDKPLTQNYTPSKHVIPIQVGAALTDQRIASVTDDTGDNISARNHRYSEMTAFYWMWKNAKADYLGICHYRRVWANLDEIVAKLQVIDADAILPLPTLSAKPIQDDFLPRHIPQVWDAMMLALQELSPDYYASAQKIFSRRILYANNMCILSLQTLDNLCKWLFPLTERVEEIIGDLEDPYYNRYAGFVTEWLITLYFLKNKSNYRIVHVEKIFIS